MVDELKARIEKLKKEKAAAEQLVRDWQANVLRYEGAAHELEVMLGVAMSKAKDAADAESQAAAK